MADNITGQIQLNELLPILDGISDSVFIDDGGGHCLWCNSACEEMYKISSSDIKGKHVEDLEKMGIFAPSVTKRVLEENREITIIHENKYRKKLLTTGTPLFSKQGNINLIITISRDITRLTDIKERSVTAARIININEVKDIDYKKNEIISGSQIGRAHV